VSIWQFIVRIVTEPLRTSISTWQERSFGSLSEETGPPDNVENVRRRQTGRCWVLCECDRTAVFIVSAGWVWPYFCLHRECWMSVTVLQSSGPVRIIVVVWEERATTQFATVRNIVIIFTAIDGTFSVDFWQEFCRRILRRKKLKGDAVIGTKGSNGMWVEGKVCEL
jgi:hypothetical protein